MPLLSRQTLLPGLIPNRTSQAMWLFYWVKASISSINIASFSFEPDVVLCSVFVNHSNTEAVLFACLSLDWATTTGRLLGSKIRSTGLSIFLKDTATRYRIGKNQGFATNLLIVTRRSTNHTTPPPFVLLIKISKADQLGSITLNYNN